MEVVQKGGEKRSRVEIVFRNEKAARMAIARPIWDDGQGGLSVARSITRSITPVAVTSDKI